MNCTENSQKHLRTLSPNSQFCQQRQNINKQAWKLKKWRILQERPFSRNFCEKMVQASVTLTLRIDLSCRRGGFSLLKTCRRLQTPNRSSWCPNAKNIYSSAAIFRELFTTSLLRKVLVFRKLVFSSSFSSNGGSLVADIEEDFTWKRLFGAQTKNVAFAKGRYQVVIQSVRSSLWERLFT